MQRNNEANAKILQFLNLNITALQPIFNLPLPNYLHAHFATFNSRTFVTLLVARMVLLCYQRNYATSDIRLMKLSP